MDFKGDVEHRLCQICGPILSSSVVYETHADSAVERHADTLEPSRRICKPHWHDICNSAPTNRLPSIFQPRPSCISSGCSVQALVAVWCEEVTIRWPREARS